MEELQKNGFILLKNVLSPADIEEGRSYIGKDVVDYSKMSRFIEQLMLPSASRQMGDWNIVHAKYRVSDNNNSDASAFHRDVVCYDKWLPVLTCLTYFDETVMEVIPGSHKLQSVAYLDAYSIFSTRVRLHLKPGDILLFYGTILHRGIFTETKGRRRLIQVFDCFQTTEMYAQLSPKLIHITGDESLKDGFTMMSKVPVLIDFINTYGYLNAITGYGGKTAFETLANCDLGGRTALSSEGFCKRLDVVPGTMQTINKYILADRPHFDLSLDCRPIWHWNMYSKQMLLYSLFTLLVTIVLVYGVYVLYRYVSKTKPFLKKRRLRSTG